MFKEECRAMLDQLIKMRRDLHQIPELGLQLPQTRKYITEKLDEYGIEYTLNQGEDSGVIAYINRGKGRCVALRADMDALPIREETGLSFAFENGCMHACGHDCHTAMLLGTARVLQVHKDELDGEVRLLFQTGEEIAKGSQEMIKNGAMDGVDAVFGAHIGNTLPKVYPCGTMIIPPGAVMASYDRFIVTVRGMSCHGSTPEKGTDPINIAAHIVLALQSLIAREFNACEPVVLTIGKIQGGSLYNIIPDEVVIEGTIRALDEAVRQKLAHRIEEIASAQAVSFGGLAQTEMDWGAPSVVNEDKMRRLAVSCAVDVLGDDQVVTSVEKTNMGGEDFAYYLEKVPGAFMFLSSVNPEKVPGSDLSHHNGRFTVDESVLWEVPAVFAEIAVKFLKQGE